MTLIASLALLALAQPAASQPNTVSLPLAEYERVLKSLADYAKEADRRGSFVLGAARYDGQVGKDGVLEMSLALEIVLTKAGDWKEVPILGAQAAVVSAAVGGVPIPLQRRGEHHVWLTDRAGTVRVDVRFMVDAYGPRGSREYRFTSAPAAVARLSCYFPLPNLHPRVDGASNEEVRPERGGTRYEANLAPRGEIRILGMRELEQAEERPATLITRGMHLLSLSEQRLELFSVFEYTILYAGARQFEIALPAGWELDSADGAGAIQFVLEDRAGVSVLRGESSFPIRQRYEISLRLKRVPDKGEQQLAAPLPRALGVEREQGFLAIEVPGKLALTPLTTAHVRAIDKRDLPAAMLASAVSPILHAYRFDVLEGEDVLRAPQVAVQLRAVRLPEREVAGQAIDRVRAFTVVTPDGKVVHELRYTLRNQERRSLALTLPPGFAVITTLLGGDPIMASRGKEGQVLLPLRRSEGEGGAARPFDVQVVLGGEGPALGLLGRRDLELPAVDLPVSSLAWSVFVPAHNRYTRLRSEIAPQHLARASAWYRSGAEDSVGGEDLGDELGYANEASNAPVFHGMRDGRGDLSDLSGLGLGNRMGGRRRDSLEQNALSFDEPAQQALIPQQRWGGAGLAQQAAEPAPRGFGGGAGAASADQQGAMPVRIQVPHDGVRLEYQRHWLTPGVPVAVWVWWLRGWLRYPLAALLVGLMLALAVLVRRGSLGGTRRSFIGGVLGLFTLGLGVALLSGRGMLALALVGTALISLAPLATAERARVLADQLGQGLRRTWQATAETARGQPPQWWLVRVLLLGLVPIVALVTLALVLDLLGLLARPL